MSVLYHTESSDDSYSHETIAKAMELSPAADDYVTMQTYLRETLPESVTPEWLRNRLVRLLLEELEALGVSIAMEIDAMLDSPELVTNILVLRAKFDPDRMYELLRNRPSVANDIREFLADDDCIMNIVGYLHEVLPLDEGWESLVRLDESRPGVLMSTEKLIETMESVFERLDRLGEPDITENVSMDKVQEFTKAVVERRERIGKVAEAIYAEGKIEAGAKEVRLAAVRNLLPQFEHELSRPKMVEKWNTVGGCPFKFISEVRKPYLPKWTHTIEHWIRPEFRNSVPTELQMAFLVATLYVDAPDQEKARLHVLETFENVIDQFDAVRRDKFRKMIDDALSNLVVFNGGVFYATK